MKNKFQAAKISSSSMVGLTAQQGAYPFLQIWGISQPFSNGRWTWRQQRKQSPQRLLSVATFRHSSQNPLQHYSNTSLSFCRPSGTNGGYKMQGSCPSLPIKQLLLCICVYGQRKRAVIERAHEPPVPIGPLNTFQEVCSNIQKDCPENVATVCSEQI